MAIPANTQSMSGDAVSSATAHAPGSVTMIFAPPAEPADGSFGVSFAIEDGVVATVESGSETTISLDGESTDFEPVEIALGELGVTADVSLAAEVPVGYGFGASGGATLATVLAANETAALGNSREELVDVAHRAEVKAGTGLGDVFIQNRGGLVWNTGDGRQSAEATESIEYSALGGIATEDVLSDEQTIERIRDVGQNSLSQFSPGEPLRDLIDLSWTFAQQTGLATEQVTDEVRRVERAGGVASMAMVGETVIGTGVQGVLEHRTAITNCGASVR
jgi:pantoate kinase